jgi:PERQ amino acid-rich with GYF domain-containing protein
MQKWYDEGYFTPDLLMKRTNVDAEWTPVAELGRRCGDKKIFLSQQMVSVPPGLSRHVDSPIQNFALPTEQNVEPYQPAPVRSLRTSALESYLASGSNPSDSPTSSFASGGGGLGNGSPDTAARGVPAGNYSYSAMDSPIGTRVSAFSANSDPSAYGVRRNPYHDTSLDSSSLSTRASFVNIAPGRAPSIDAYSFNGPYSSAQQSAWPSSSAPISSSYEAIPAARGTTDLGSLPSSFGHPSSSIPSLTSQTAYSSTHGPQEIHHADTISTVFPGSDYAIGELEDQLDAQYLASSADDGDLSSKLGFNNYVNGPFTNPSHGQQYAMSAPSHYPMPPHPQSLQHLPSPFGQQAINSNVVAPTSHPPPSSAVSARSPWNSQEPTTVRRPGPFDPLHPTSSNTVLSERPPSPPQLQWSRPSQIPQPPLPNDPSPWFLASQGVADESWKEIPGPSSLTFRNVGQHNQQQELAAPTEKPANVQEIMDQSHQLAVVESVPPPAAQATAPVPSGKQRRKSTTPLVQTQAPASKSIPAPPLIAKSPSSPALPTALVKPAWLTEDESKKTKPVSASLSLRDIQEAESKKNEARKAAERERERATRPTLSIPAAVEDLQPFTASWGLPTSQAGTARNNASQKETAVATSPAPPTSAAWTNTNKVTPTKKTMKEIQEEERRKKTAHKETMAAAAASAPRRIYSETTSKVSLSWGCNLANPIEALS